MGALDVLLPDSDTVTPTTLDEERYLPTGQGKTENPDRIKGDDVGHRTCKRVPTLQGYVP